MNKKEFEEKFTVEYSVQYREHKRRYITTSTLSDELWQWKEKEIKDARIDELKKIMLMDNKMHCEYKTIHKVQFENRLKELSK